MNEPPVMPATTPATRRTVPTRIQSVFEVLPATAVVARDVVALRARDESDEPPTARTPAPARSQLP